MVKAKSLRAVAWVLVRHQVNDEGQKLARNTLGARPITPRHHMGINAV